jgi:hypothetical protein
VVADSVTPELCRGETSALPITAARSLAVAPRGPVAAPPSPTETIASQ